LHLFFIGSVMYKELLEQYNNLTEEERKSLFVYKTQFFDLINSVISISDFRELSVDTIIKLLNDNVLKNTLNFGKIISKPNNVVIKYSYFNDVDFSNYESIISKVFKVYDNLSNVFNHKKMILPTDFTVYRVVCLSRDNELQDMSRGEFVSASIDLDSALEFVSGNNIVVYKINLMKGTPVVATPYSVINVYSTEADKLLRTSNYNIKVSKTESFGQQEVLFSKNLIDYDIKLLKSNNIDGKKISIYEVNTSVKCYNKKN